MRNEELGMSLRDKVPIDYTPSLSEMNLTGEKAASLIVNGNSVNFIEYEPVEEGDFVKVCTNDHDLGVAAEYAWFENKYHNAVLLWQEFTTIKLNGIKTKCDILTIRTDIEIKTIYFDISQMMEDLNEKNKKTVTTAHGL
jgi:uncharacterized protein YifE (UPF0438 family)